MFLRKHFLDGVELTLLEDVMQNLSWILSTRRGSGYFLEDFGVSDVGFRTPAEMVVSMTDEIRQNIRLYEPRVEVIDVDEDWDETSNQPKLVVRLRLRERSEKLEVIVDLAKRSFDVRPVTSARARRNE
ncbi:MAG TPA: GPW/gp25 family protein [Polyangiaceae bacterium]|nr:GPW/gp25 family protein [Polyangiaceae bacterium]